MRRKILARRISIEVERRGKPREGHLLAAN
jgi:hypothetical protein